MYRPEHQPRQERLQDAPGDPSLGAVHQNSRTAADPLRYKQLARADEQAGVLVPLDDLAVRSSDRRTVHAVDLDLRQQVAKAAGAVALAAPRLDHAVNVVLQAERDKRQGFRWKDSA